MAELTSAAEANRESQGLSGCTGILKADCLSELIFSTQRFQNYRGCAFPSLGLSLFICKMGGTNSLNQVVARIGICEPWGAIETLEDIIVSDIIIQGRQARRTQSSSLGRAYKTDVLIKVTKRSHSLGPFIPLERAGQVLPEGSQTLCLSLSPLLMLYACLSMLPADKIPSKPLRRDQRVKGQMRGPQGGRMQELCPWARGRKMSAGVQPAEQEVTARGRSSDVTGKKGFLRKAVPKLSYSIL